MGLFSWFRSSRPEDYEGVLARLASEINAAKQRLSEVRLRERRFSLLLNAYGVGMWAIWFGLWWFGGIPWALIGWSDDDTKARVLGLVGAIAGPVLIFLLNYFIRFVFTRIRTSEETHLRLLFSKQRKQVEEIKRITNFDSTRKLLEQYDAMNVPPQPQKGQGGPGGKPGTPVKGQPGHPGQPQSGQQDGGSSPTTPQRHPQTPETPGAPGAPTTPATPRTPLPPSTPVPVPPGMTPEQAALFSMQLQAIQPILPTPEKKWYDRLADTILGDDPAQGAESKYALVCGECFRHNGLVGNKYEWERMQWICPRCEHLNLSPLSRMGPILEDPETPSKPAKKPVKKAEPPAAPVTPSLRSQGSGGVRRRLGERPAPRQSRLSTEVFSAADADSDEEEGGEEMEVDS